MTQVSLDEEEFERWQYFQQLEDEYKCFLYKFNDKELLTIFPEIKSVLPRKLKEWIKTEKSLRDIIRFKLKRLKSNTSNEFEFWFCRELVKQTDGQVLLEIKRHISRIKRQMYILSGKKSKGLITDEHIEQAMSVPITDLYDGQLRRSGNNLVGLCPFHTEKSPSFTVFRKNNSCWCFGCQQGGNSIKFVMLFHGYSFIEAVKYLIGINI